jgi:hypothetical protein
MQISATKLGLATAFSLAILWTICSLMVYVMPSQMMYISAQMVHVNPADFAWDLNLLGFFVGLVSWSVVGCITVWLSISIYNLVFEKNP